MNRVARSFFALASVLSTLSLAACSDTGSEAEEGGGSAQSEGDRPPQFVILAFDGSQNIAFWNESREFARTTQAELRNQNPEATVKFTYFANSVYFIPDANKREYTAPHGLGAGKSAIGWGGDVATINERYKQVEAAHDEGHEIGSHANGHWDGSQWTESDWRSEFDQFDRLFWTGVGGVTPGLSFPPSDSVGFRAPQLGHSPGLYTVLASHGYAYDTSKVAQANYWPQQINGVWNFALASLKIIGSGKNTLSMDYNFYVADSAAAPKPENMQTYKKQMIDTYMAYFEGNYFGNRAPVHIGHHFSKWNGGAYWEAMKTFTKRVCGLPEVKCGTYKDLLKFVTDNKAKLPTYQRGEFTKMVRPPSSEPYCAVGAEGCEVSPKLSDSELSDLLGAHENHDDE